MLEYGALLAMVLLTCLGQVFMKLGAGRVVYGRGLRILLRSFVNRQVIVGVVLALCAPFFYIFALTRISLAVAYSFTGLNYVLILLVSRVFLRERVNRFQYAGVLLIFGGVLVFNL